MFKTRQRDFLYFFVYGASVLTVAFLLSTEHHGTISNIG